MFEIVSILRESKLFSDIEVLELIDEDTIKVIIRWDNSPHWRKVKTFPYHKHIADDVFSCQKMSISDVISEIEGKIKDANSPD